MNGFIQLVATSALTRPVLRIIADSTSLTLFAARLLRPLGVAALSNHRLTWEPTERRQSTRSSHLDSPTDRPRILVIHYLRQDSRMTQKNYVTSLGFKGLGVEVHFQNIFGLAASKDSPYTYDLGIVVYDVLSLRESPTWHLVEKRLVRLLGRCKTRVLMPQDDYTFSRRLDELATNAKVDVIFSPIDWGVEDLYPKSTGDKIKFVKCLTGYLSNKDVRSGSELGKPWNRREIDLGQRVRRLGPSFGYIGQRKYQIAEKLASEFEARSLRTDVSFKESDVLLGNEWLSFLGNTKFTVSRKGGSSLADTENRMTRFLQVRRAVGAAPTSRVARKAALLKGVKEGEYSSESPRLFEAASLGVCQILEEDTYLQGVLKPWIHFVPLKSDFSNLDSIFEFTQAPQKIEEMVRKCREVLIDSGDFSYEKFAEMVIFESIGIRRLDSMEDSLKVDLDQVHSLSDGLSLNEIRDRALHSPIWKILMGLGARSGCRELGKREFTIETLVTPWRDTSFTD